LLLEQEAMALSKKLNYPKGIAETMLLEGEIYCEKGAHEKSLLILQNALDYSVAHHFYQQAGTAYQQISINFALEGEDLDKRILYIRKAIPYFKMANAKLLHGQTAENLGDLYRLKSDYENSINTLQQVLSIYNDIGYQETQGVYCLLGYASLGKKDNVNALKYLLTALKVAERQRDSTAMLSNIYNRLGILHVGLGKFKESQTFLEKGLVVAENTKDSASTANIKANLLPIYIAAKKYKDAEKLFKSIDFPHPDPQYRSTVLYAGASIYLYLKKYKLASPYIDSLRRYTVKAPNEPMVWRHYYMTSMKYDFETGKYQAAKDEIMNDQVIKRFQTDQKFLRAYELFCFRIDSALGNDRAALVHYKNFSLLRDSLTKVDNAKQLSELQIQFDIEGKDKDITLLTQKSLLQQTKIDNQEIVRNAIIAGLLVLLIFSGLLYNRYLLKQRINKKLEIKQAEINEQNRLLQKFLTEKEWLLKEIHHRVKNNLQVIISLLNTQSAFLDNQDALTAIQNSKHRMHAMSLIHQKLYQSDNLASIDMAWYIKELISFLKDSFSSDNKIKFTLDTESIMLDVAHAVPLGLILNEAITNAMKYAFPVSRKGEIAISLKYIQEDTVLLSIIDNGTGLPEGFDPEKSSSIGMNMMQGLSEQLDGNFTVKNENGLALYVTFNHTPSLVSLENQ
jgi:two-component sensor histidine kinase